jgi:hypothetical protein
MLSDKSFERISKYKSEINPETGENPSSKLLKKINSEDITLIRVEESNGNYHNKVKINYNK